MSTVFERPILLSNDWIKRVFVRKTGKWEGQYYAYIISPTGRRLRSNLEIIKFMIEHRHMNIKINPYEVNTDVKIVLDQVIFL
jgi:hypothetical protein